MQLYDEYPSENATASPGVCFRCRSHERHGAPVLNTGIQIEDEMGLVYFDRACVLEMAHLYGVLTPEAAEDLLAKNDELRNSNRQYGAQVSALRKALAAERELREVAEERLSK